MQKKIFSGMLMTILLLGIIAPTQMASGYEEDIHYWLKFKLGLYCGYTINQSRLIATGDQGVDANFSTEPTKISPFEHGGNPFSSDTYENLNIKIKWHALPQDNPVSDPAKGIPDIKQGQDALYNRAMKETNPSIKLIKFGQYLHYIEDKWSHWGYTFGVGHGLVNVFGDSPDNPGVTSLAVKDMIYDVMTQMGALSGKDSKCFNAALGGNNPFMTPVNFTPDFRDIYPKGPPPASTGVSNQPMSGQRDSYLKSLDDSNSNDKITDFYNDLINTAKKATAQGSSLEEVVAFDITTIQNHIAKETNTSLTTVQHDYDFISPWEMHGPFGFALWVFSSRLSQGIHWDEDGEPIEKINPDPEKVFDDPKINPHPHTPSAPPIPPKVSLQPPSGQNTKTAKLLVIKHVINDGGGTAKASDFKITITPGPYLTINPSQFSGSEEGTEITLSGNFDQLLRYTVKEDSPYGDKYKVSYTDNCKTYINAGEYLGCVIYNTYVPPTTNQTSQSAGQIPKWVQNNALWWSQGQIKDKEFATAIGYLVSQGIIKLQSKGVPGTTIIVSDDISIPQWIKNNANWWSKGIITDSDFVQGLQYMLDNNIITFSKHVQNIQNVNLHSNLKLRILDPNSKTGLDAIVEISGNGKNIKMTTDRDGYINVILPDGDYSIQIDSQEFQRMKVPLQVHGNTTKAITMEEPQNTETNQDTTQQPSSPAQVQADFDVSISPNVVDIEQDVGTYSNSIITIDSTVPFTNELKVDVSVEPPGLGVDAHEEGYSTVQYPGDLQKHLLNGKYELDDLIYVVVDQYAQPGTYQVKVTVSSDMGNGVITRTSILTVHVTSPKTFSVSASPNVLTVVQGGSVTTQVTATTNEQLSGQLYLMAGNGPDIHSGLKFDFPGTLVEVDPQTGYVGGTPVSPTPGAPVTRTLTITAKDNAVLGTHTIWVNAHTGVPFNDVSGDIHNSNMYVPVTVNVVAPTTQDQQSTPQTSPQTQPSETPHVSATPSSASFTHNIGVTSCPELISKINLQSDQQGAWSVIGNPSWTSITIQDGVATINFNCQLSQYVTQTLSGDAEFMFKGTSGGINSVSVPISGQVNKN